MRELAAWAVAASISSSFGCSSSSDEPNLHDPTLVVGTWNVPASGPAEQRAVQAVVYRASRFVETFPSGSGGLGTCLIQGDRLDMQFSCTTPNPGNVYCNHLSVNFEVTNAQLKWIWTDGSSWLFDRSASQL